MPLIHRVAEKRSSRKPVFKISNSYSFDSGQWGIWLRARPLGDHNIS